ncbi:MAG: CPBP family intramembrane metalloprotease [Candidatus Latescibacter sp.]|nr:CPBP family intramembrane metalloprotease [Candidatus Latescibacter sp.]
MYESPTGISREKWEWLILAALLTWAAHLVPEQIFFLTWTLLPPFIQAAGEENYWYLLSLTYGLFLVLPSLSRSGIRIGDIRSHWRGVLFACGIPIILTAIVYPLLPVRPFADSAAGMWLISPLAQDLVFIGFLYGRFEILFPTFIHPRFRIKWALLISALFFSAWHLPNFSTMPAEFVVFQLFYTVLIYLAAGLSRQWTGSILYFTLAHSCINFIVWWVK